MPRVDGDERALSLSPSLTLKRGRSERDPAAPCFEKCCAMTVPSLKLKRGGSPLEDLSFPEDDEEVLDEDFDLGPPPPPPMLCRQNAMDATAARQLKLCRSVAGACPSHSNSPSEAPSLPLPPRSSLSSSSSRVRRFLVAPALVRPTSLPN